MKEAGPVMKIFAAVGLGLATILALAQGAIAQQIR
jgi:hypothetical protein